MQMRSLPKAERERWARRTLVLAAARADRPVSVRSGAHVDKPVARD
jgi:hypothetical protein